MPTLPDWPGTWSGATITGTFVDTDGNPIVGKIRFRADRRKWRPGVMPSEAYSATLDTSGAFSITLPATNDSDVHESFMYEVTESAAWGV